jgi:hypothetical protein
MRTGKPKKALSSSSARVEALNDAGRTGVLDPLCKSYIIRSSAGKMRRQRNP